MEAYLALSRFCQYVQLSNNKKTSADIERIKILGIIYLQLMTICRRNSR